MFEKPTNNPHKMIEFMTPEFLDAKQFINDEKFKKYNTDEEQYNKMRIDLLKLMLKNKSKS